MTMRYILCFMLLTAAFITVFTANKGGVDKCIVKQVTDSRGLISVQYKIGSDTMAFDYLTKEEYDSLFK